jgi:prolyl-tRNA synthetase
MRLSTLFGQRLREVPAEAELPGHQLALRAGLIRQVAQGIYALLPVGWRVIRRIEAIIREEMEGIGGQEISMPVVQPAELWQASGRFQAASPGPALARFQDRNGHPLVLGMTHEEVVTDLARQEIHSYRQLPSLVFQVQVKFRDEPRSRGGLVRTREFLMKDAYSFDRDEAGMAEAYARVYAAYERIFSRCGLPVRPVEAASGMMGGHVSHEFMYPSPYGEDQLLTCPACGYAANVEGARITLTPRPPDAARPVEEVATPGMTTIAALAEYLRIEAAQTLKAVFYQRADTGGLVFAVIRGDLEVNEAKLSAVLGGVDLVTACEETLSAAGVVPGYASPIGFTGGTVVADESVRSGANYVAGANRPGYHLKNVNVPRDFAPDLYADITLARAGDACPVCCVPLESVRAIEVGHIFQLGTKYAEALGAGFLDESGGRLPLQMGCYGIGLGRLMACIMEAHHDAQGLIWPTAIAPFDAHLVSLARPGTDEERAAEALNGELAAAGLDVLYDDRPERAGVKFNDADLLGVPVRLTLSPRTLAQGAVEFKLRWESEVRIERLEPLEGLVAAIRDVHWPYSV